MRPFSPLSQMKYQDHMSEIQVFAELPHLPQLFAHLQRRHCVEGFQLQLDLGRMHLHLLHPHLPLLHLRPYAQVLIYFQRIGKGTCLRGVSFKGQLVILIYGMCALVEERQSVIHWRTVTAFGHLGYLLLIFTPLPLPHSLQSLPVVTLHAASHFIELAGRLLEELRGKALLFTVLELEQQVLASGCEPLSLLPITPFILNLDGLCDGLTHSTLQLMLYPAFLVVKVQNHLLIGLVSAHQISQNTLPSCFSQTELIQELLPTDIHHVFQILVDGPHFSRWRRPHLITHHDFRFGDLLLSGLDLANLEGGVEEGLSLRRDVTMGGTAVQVTANLKLGKAVDVAVLQVVGQLAQQVHVLPQLLELIFSDGLDEEVWPAARLHQDLLAAHLQTQVLVQQLWDLAINCVDAAEDDLQQTIGHALQENHSLLAHSIPPCPTLHHSPPLCLSSHCLSANALGKGTAVGDLLMEKEECVVGMEQGVDVGGEGEEGVLVGADVGDEAVKVAFQLLLQGETLRQHVYFVQQQIYRIVITTISFSYSYFIDQIVQPPHLLGISPSHDNCKDVSKYSWIW